MTEIARIGVVGGTGYTGAELIRLVGGHPHAEVALVTSTRQAGTAVSALYPALAGAAAAANGGGAAAAAAEAAPLVYETLDVASAKERCDGFFVCAPHGVAMDVVPDLLDEDHWVIDLSADFRLADPEVYAAWYGCDHAAPVLLAEAAYGLTELFREDVAGARLVANPGCYPTAALLALAPALSAGLIAGGSVVIDAKSGVSGAGREPSPSTAFSECAESMTAYKVACHRHTPEIEEGMARLTGAPDAVSFTPHLAPMVRGILATCYGTLAGGGAPGAAAGKPDTAAIVELYREHYAEEPFVHVLDAGEMPATKSVSGSNRCHIGVAVDERTGRLVAVSAIDNLVKGASGQAVQNMNVMLGFDETAGLDAVGRVI